MLSSVKSGADAIPTRPATRSGIARASSNAIQPPIDEPTRTCGPSVSAVTAARQKITRRLAMPRIVKPQEGTPIPFGPILQIDRLRPLHIGFEPAQKHHPRPLTGSLVIGNAPPLRRGQMVRPAHVAPLVFFLI